MNVTLLTVGDNVVDRYPALGMLSTPAATQSTWLCTGVAVAPARHTSALRAPTSRARAVLDALVAEGVDTSLQGRRGAERLRGRAVVDGNRVFDHGDPGVSRFALTPADFAAVAAASIVHTGSARWSRSSWPTSQRRHPALLRLLRASGRLHRRIRPLVDIAIRSLPCATREDAAAEAHRIQALGPDLVAVTMGAGGAVALHEGQLFHAPAPPTTVVDTLGAGDAFIARLITGLIAEAPLAAPRRRHGLRLKHVRHLRRVRVRDLARGLTAPLNPIHKGVDLS